MYPPVGFHFKVVFGLDEATSADAGFQQVSGLSVDLNTEEVVEGGENRFAYRLPIRTKYPNLVLKRGLLKDSGLIDWISGAIENLEIVPIDILISLLDEEHQPLISWNVRGAYPLKWSLSDMQAMENAVAIETLELSYQFFRRV